jgi:hypothetical protein
MLVYRKAKACISLSSNVHGRYSTIESTSEEVTMRTTLLEVDPNESTLTTIEGKVFFVVPEDLTICCTWTPTTAIEIVVVGRRKVCRNLSTGQQVVLV